MLQGSKAFSSFSVRDSDAARRFYGQTLGVKVTDLPEMGGLFRLELEGGMQVLVYPKPDHAPATFTVLNFAVRDLERSVEALKERGVRFEIYRDGPVRTDERGISQGDRGPKMAWFRDPAGNILSLLQERVA